MKEEWSGSIGWVVMGPLAGSKTLVPITSTFRYSQRSAREAFCCDFREWTNNWRKRGYCLRKCHLEKGGDE